MIKYIMSLLVATVGATDIPFATEKYGEDANYKLKIRALLAQNPPILEMHVCIPNGTWFGLGFGGDKMINSELVFFFAGATKDTQKVLSMRMEKGQKPNDIFAFP